MYPTTLTILKRMALPALLVLTLSRAIAADTPQAFYQQFMERVPAVVAVQYLIQHETEREREEGVGLVLDEEGLIVLGEETIPGWMPPGQFRDFKLFPPGHEGNGFEAEYLGQDYRTRWHYLRASEEVRDQLVPITEFASETVYAGSQVWGVHLLRREFNYEPAVIRSTVGLLREMPLETAFTADDVGVAGSAVFTESGNFAGWLGPGIPQEKILYMGRDNFNVGLQSVRGSTVFLTADVFLKRAGRVPASVTGERGPWIGVAGMEPLDSSVAELMELQEQGAIVISDIIAGSPAEKAGLQSRDVITHINGEILPKFSPSSILLRYFEDRLLRHQPGEDFALSVLRDDAEEPRDVVIALTEAPSGLKDAERQYFDRIGLSVREFVLYDGLSRRQLQLEFKGGILHFIRQNSPADNAGLSRGDWVKEIDGQEIHSYEEARSLLDTIEADETLQEIVLLIERQNETRVIQVKLD